MEVEEKRRKRKHLDKLSWNEVLQSSDISYSIMRFFKEFAVATYISSFHSFVSFLLFPSFGHVFGQPPFPCHPSVWSSSHGDPDWPIRAILSYSGQPKNGCGWSPANETLLWASSCKYQKRGTFHCWNHLLWGCCKPWAAKTHHCLKERQPRRKPNWKMERGAKSR